MSFTDHLLHCNLPKVVGALLLFVVGLFLWNVLKRPRGIPPGPYGLPIVGSLLSFGSDDPMSYFTELRKKYGNIYSIYFGSRLNIFINDLEMAKDAFLKHGEVFSARPESFLFREVAGGKDGLMHGLVQSEGRLWKEQRKFALSKLREFGMGKLSLEEKIKEEISAFLNECRNKDEQAFDIVMLINNSVSNIICSILLGNRFEYTDKKFRSLMENMRLSFSNKDGDMLDTFPWTRFLPKYRKSYKEMVTSDRCIYQFISDCIDEHEKTYDPENTRDFIDAYLNVINEEKDTGDAETTFSKFELVHVAGDLFFAGTETTSTTLRWGFLYMLKYPEVMKKVQAEIDEVIGRSRMPSYADKAKMPYAEATLAEIQRLANIAPFGVPHAVSETVEFHGYTIPARTSIIVYNSAILSDPATFPQPEQFMPERHLHEDGTFKKIDAVIPFSIGRRVCLGEALARMELFLYFTSMLQNFNLQSECAASELNLKPDVGFTCCPYPYNMKCLIR